MLAHPDWPRLFEASLVQALSLSREQLAGGLALLGTTLTSYVYVWETIGRGVEEPPDGITPGTRLGLFADPVRLPGPAVPATSSSPSSAASRAPRPRPDPAAPKTGHAAQASPRRFPRIQLVYISRPPNKRRGTHKNNAELESQT